MRLIDANELEIELTKQKAHLMDKSYHTTIEFDRMMYINTATGLIHAINILHNAPTVEPEPYFEKAEKDRRIYERGFEDGQNARPQGESKTVQDCIIAYGDGFESARRLFERPHGKWIDPQNVGANNWCSVCGEFILHYNGIHNYCSNCGADMRKGEDND